MASNLKAFAATKIPIYQTQEDLEGLLARRGIRASRWTHFAEVGTAPGTVRFEFEWQKSAEVAPIGFRIEVNYKGDLGPKGGQIGSSREQAGRALFWHIKNLFDAVDFGIVEMEQAFMPYMLAAGDRTVYQHMQERLPELLASGSMTRLLTEGRNG